MEIELELRKNYLSIDKLNAICSFGTYYKIGDVIGHEGADDTATIKSFEIDDESDEVIVNTDKGYCHLDFIYHIK